MKKALTIGDEKHARTLSGDLDRNLKMIEQVTGVKVGIRGERVFFEGSAEKVNEVLRLVTDIVGNIQRGAAVSSEEMENLFRQSANGSHLDYTLLTSESIVITPRKTVVPKSLNQKPVQCNQCANRWPTA